MFLVNVYHPANPLFCFWLFEILNSTLPNVNSKNAATIKSYRKPFGASGHIRTLTILSEAGSKDASSEDVFLFGLGMFEFWILSQFLLNFS